MDLILDFEAEGFSNVDIEKEEDCVRLRSNVRCKEDFLRWKELFCTRNKQCFNVYTQYPVGQRKLFRQKLVCLHGVKHKGVRKTFTNCRVFMDVTIRIVHKRSPDHMRNFPCFIAITGHHNHSLEAAIGLNQLRVAASTKAMFENYFEQGMTPAQAHRHHMLKMDLSNDIYNQDDHAINPTQRAIQHMWDRWRKKEHGGLNTPTMFEAIQKYAEDNPEIIVKFENFDTSFCVVLVTPFMMRSHKQLKEAGEVVFVDAISCDDKLNTAVMPFLCAGPAGAVPLAVMFTSSQDERILTKGFSMVKEVLGDCAFYGRREPQCFMTDNCEAERKALASTWPTSKLFLCVFHILQQVWRWLLDSKNGIHKENRQELISMMKSLVYAVSRDEFNALWIKAQANSLLEKYSNFRSYLTTLVQRREEWAIAFRAGAMLRGLHTNNFVEAVMCIIKDVILNRCKAFNAAQLLVFMVEIFDCYMRQRLVDVALRRQQSKSISIDRTDSYTIKSLGQGLYSAQSQSDQTQIYEVDLIIGMCSCIKGQSGAICKHQIACAEYGLTAVPQIFVSASSNRQWLAALGVDSENENEGDGVDISNEIDIKMEAESIQTEVECFPNDTSGDICDLSIQSTEMTEKLHQTIMKYGNSETQAALQRFVRHVTLIKTPNQLNSLLNCAGSSVR